MSTSVKIRKMTATKGSENKKAGTHRSSPKLTKYLQNLGVNKTPSTTSLPTMTTQERQNAMPTPTRNSSQKESTKDQVCEPDFPDDTESESEIMSVNSETLMEESSLKFPYDNLEDLERECQDMIDPRTTALT